MKNALLVVDVQSYFLKDAPKDLPVRITNHYRSIKYDLIAFTVFRNKRGSNFVKSLKWDKCSSDEDVKLPKVFAPLINPQNVFERAAYSAFKTTGLNNYLKKAGVSRLVICGVDTDACVLATAFEAFDLGYHLKIDFDLTFSSADLEGAAQKIAKRSLISRD